MGITVHHAVTKCIFIAGGHPFVSPERRGGGIHCSYS